MVYTDVLREVSGMNSDNRRAVFAPGMTIADRFELLRPLGRGTMGSLWVAHHKSLDVDVALKFIDPDLVDRADLRSRFAQEAMAAARIRSPHVVSVLDFGEAEGSQPYIAMELLEGVSLAQRLEQDKHLSLSDTVRVLVHACKGLAKAHGQGIVHRDLKPENLFLSEDEEEEGFVLKILDFGIAKASSPTTGMLHRTITGQLVGTPLYMSPEQAVSRPTTPQSDLYSIASVAYHCLTGRPVFHVANIAILLVYLATRTPAPLRQFLPDAPEELEAWFVRALDKDPEKRFANARELAETFVRACQSAGSLHGLSVPTHVSDPRSQDSWDDMNPAPAPRFSSPVPEQPAPARMAAAPELTPAPVGSDTLVDEGIARASQEASSDSPLPASARVRVVDASGNRSDTEMQALGLAPTMKDQSGLLGNIVRRVAEQTDPSAAARDALAHAPESPPQQGDAASQSNALGTALWILGSLLAIGVAVAVGWFIGRAL